MRIQRLEIQCSIGEVRYSEGVLVCHLILTFKFLRYEHQSGRQIEHVLCG